MMTVNKTNKAATVTGIFRWIGMKQPLDSRKILSDSWHEDKGNSSLTRPPTPYVDKWRYKTQMISLCFVYSL
jgi:hypothetical protein